MIDQNQEAILAEVTLAESAARKLRRDIIAGSLPPEARLRLRELSARYGLGATPLREALARLAAEGLVRLEGQKGFSVPPVTRAHLQDITQSRQIAEAAALRLAMAEGDAEWEDGIVAALSVLGHEIGRRDMTSEAWLDSYEVRHHRFHAALIAGCPLPSLKRFCDELYVQKTRYRRIIKIAALDWDHMLRVHARLAELTLARDPAATQELTTHIGKTAEQVVEVLEGVARPGSGA